MSRRVHSPDFFTKYEVARNHAAHYTASPFVVEIKPGKFLGAVSASRAVDRKGNVFVIRSTFGGWKVVP